ncbi:Lsr2 family protein [Terrabacter sp. NPDC000476]|uniref:histone-like nucleoid-structuring protein Lsr2 n=1 Tax=Terrabacter sp. NPDC000476 TaxID=3154258 RepID=UPI00332695DD
MAQRIQTILEDDIDGGPADTTIQFSYQGTQYEIDLCNKNEEKFIKALEPFTSKARKTGGGRRAAAKTAVGKTDKNQLQAVRQWARVNGHTVSDRGRISQEVQDAYNASR